MRKIEEMLNQLENLKAEAQKFLDEGGLDEAKAKLAEINKLKDAISIQQALDQEEEERLAQMAQNRKETPHTEDAAKAFANAARNGFQNAMSSGSGEDGGYTVPEDIQTAINKYRESKDSLQVLIKVERVKAPSGQRTYKKRSQQTGFSEVSEGGKISKKETPKFERQSYAVKKYAGYFPVTSELLEDSDANIIGTLVEWIGDESRITRNKLILAVIAAEAKTTFKTIDDIKKALNVTLDASFKNTSVIVTNQDGIQYFDTLKDNDGKYLLQPVVGDNTRFMLFGRPIKAISSYDLPSDTSTAKKRTIPVIIGDLKEGIVMYDKKTLNIKSSDVAMNAFEDDLTLFRAIEREEVKIRDGQAFVNGAITINDDSVTV